MLGLGNAEAPAFILSMIAGIVVSDTVKGLECQRRHSQHSVKDSIWYRWLIERMSTPTAFGLRRIIHDSGRHRSASTHDRPEIAFVKIFQSDPRHADDGFGRGCRLRFGGGSFLGPLGSAGPCGMSENARRQLGVFTSPEVSVNCTRLRKACRVWATGHGQGAQPPLISHDAREGSHRQPLRRWAGTAGGGCLCGDRRSTAAACHPRSNRRRARLCDRRQEPFRDSNAHFVLGCDPWRIARGDVAGRRRSLGDGDCRGGHGWRLLPHCGGAQTWRAVRFHLATSAARLRLRAGRHHHPQATASHRRRAGTCA